MTGDEAPLDDVESEMRIYARSPIDGGPIYAETVDLSATIVEPWNAASASLFIVIVLVWAWRLRGRYRDYPFLTLCLPILLTGGIGGTLYHAWRSHRVWFLLDVVPISVLGVAVSIYLWLWLRPKWWHPLLMLVVYAGLTGLGFRTIPHHWAITLSYATMALIIALPLAIVMLRTRFAYIGWIVTALMCFAIALLCRFADPYRPPLFPMGTHWLWHTFGALTTQALSEYIYRLEGEATKARLANPSVTDVGRLA